MNENHTADSEPDYTDLTAELFSKYGPSVRQTVETVYLPDKLVNNEEKHIAGDLIICDRTTDEPVADIGFIGSGEIIITMPADYVPPMHRQPFADIDDPETLSASGELIYEIIELVHVIIVSTYIEVTHKRKVIALVERLHQDHDYSTEDIRSGLVEVAQKRGDLPDNHS